MINRISVIGAGTMGHGMAQVFAAHGYPVSLYEPAAGARGEALARIRVNLELMAGEGYIDASGIQAALGNIRMFSELAQAVKDADYVLEAIPEDLELKRKLLLELDRLCPEQAVLATNTSSLRLSDMTSGLPPARKALTMVCHWYNPAHLIPIAELSAFGNMSEAVFNEVRQLYVKCEKRPVKILKDITGMIANRILHAQAREVFHLMEIGAASAEDIDSALMFGPGFRGATTGMLEMADMGGLDIWLTGEDNMLPDLCVDRKACDLLRGKVAEGKLGFKSGEGFFAYPEAKKGESQNAFHKRLIAQLKVSMAIDAKD
jgi:3-hydroxybutyryl-CoA dehydrogenase